MGEAARAGPGCCRLELALKEISKDFRNQQTPGGKRERTRKAESDRSYICECKNGFKRKKGVLG